MPRDSCSELQTCSATCRHLGAPCPACTTRSSPRESTGTVPCPSPPWSLRPAQLPTPTAPGPCPLLRKRNAGTGSNLYFPGLCPVGQTDSGCVGAACQLLAASFWLCLLSVCGSAIGAAGLYQVLRDTLLNAGWLWLCFHNSSSCLSETRTLGSALQQPLGTPLLQLHASSQLQAGPCPLGCGDPQQAAEPLSTWPVCMGRWLRSSGKRAFVLNCL